MKKTLIFTFIFLLFGASHTLAQVNTQSCGPLTNHFGPFDYRTERGVNLKMVEGAHFLPYIEALVRGKSNSTPGGDITYTLKVFPNHHRALMAVIRLGEKEKTPQPKGSLYTVNCWLERAVTFRPDDTTVRMIYSSYLSKNNRTQEAIAQLEHATILAKDNPFTHYNIGLVYFDMKIYDKALTQAHRAMGLGFERTELRDQLKKAGHWQEAVTAAAETSATSSSEVIETPVADSPASAPK